MKRILSFFVALVLAAGCGIEAASAAQSSGLSISLETAVYSISNETFIRTLPEPASQDVCGPDEYVTVQAVIQNTSGAEVTLRAPCISIDGGTKLGWNDITLGAGKTVRCHVYHYNEAYLTPGLHTAVFYASGQPLYIGRFSIGRAWSEVLSFPTQAQIDARPADQRSPYLSTWLSTGSGVKYDAYSVDFKSDHIPCGTYSCVFNGYLDFSSLEGPYVSADNDGHISLYGGLQSGDKGKPCQFILSFWDIYCTDESGKTTIVRPVRTYPEGTTDNDSFGNEGEGAHTQLPYDWQVGRWYRMLLQCGTSEKTGNTTVEQWFQDLTTDEWTHTCTYDIGVKVSGFTGSVAFFSENFLKQYAGEVRSLEVANVRIHTSEGWRGVSTASGINQSNHAGSLSGAYGSWEAGADDHTFYMISTGVSGWGRTEKTETLTVENRESGDPTAALTLPKEPVQFADVASGAYYAEAVQWAVEREITAGTSDTTFSPDKTCTQAEILTFLWRAKGSPKPAGTVTSSAYHAAAVRWAFEQGLTDGSFSANAPCTRARAMIYLWKLAGSPSGGSSGFTDVDASASYAPAIAWAVGEGITSGTSTATFSPELTCTRGQIVTFLHRALG